MIQKNISYDNKSESATGSIMGNFSDCQPTEQQFKIIVGYNIDNSQIYVINGINDFRDAITDGYISAENNRIIPLNKIKSENKITEEDENFIQTQKKLGIKFHDISFSPEITKKLIQWGHANRELRNKPRLDILLWRGNHDTVYLRTPNHKNTGGWYFHPFYFDNINFSELYKCALETVEHANKIDLFCQTMRSFIK